MSDQNGREVPARQATARIQRLIEDALTEHGLIYTQYQGSHGGLPGVIVELPGEKLVRVARANSQRFVERPIGWDDKVWVSFDPDAGVVLTS